MINCSNCHCDIEQSKIVLHERFCIQNIKYCDICKEAVIKEEYEEHCLEHSQNNNKSILKSEEERSNLSLQRVMSTKIQCEFCDLFLSYSEVEEHEMMCGARSTPCRLCGERIIYKNLNDHITGVHGINKSVYNEYDSQTFINDLDLNKYNDSFQQNLDLIGGKSSELLLNNLTSSEKIAYAIALSEQENNISSNKNEHKNKISDNNERIEEGKKPMGMKKNNEMNEPFFANNISGKKNSTKIENEYEKKILNGK